MSNKSVLSICKRAKNPIVPTKPVTRLYFIIASWNCFSAPFSYFNHKLPHIVYISARPAIENPISYTLIFSVIMLQKTGFTTWQTLTGGISEVFKLPPGPVVSRGVFQSSALYLGVFQPQSLRLESYISPFRIPSIRTDPSAVFHSCRKTMWPAGHLLK